MLVIDIHKLYGKYLTLNIPNPFTLEEIDARFRQRYLAEEIDIECFADLKKDRYANFHTARRAYIFRNKQVSDELIKLNPIEDLESLRTAEFNIILNSEDNIYLSGATEQGRSYLLALETSIFCGIEEEDMRLGNEEFEDYLKALYLTGYIQFENDPLIEKAYQRYRAGYTLKWYGYTAGKSTF
ncbi:pyruvate kinase [Paenibacillus apiarius]|uniref:pyruvate kinase n=1 Tax=Paenibacillus apiarius TaxID=46240 RepID=UPI003B3B350C